MWEMALMLANSVSIVLLEHLTSHMFATLCDLAIVCVCIFLVYRLTGPDWSCYITQNIPLLLFLKYTRARTHTKRSVK